jgi:hypothetical protein
MSANRPNEHQLACGFREVRVLGNGSITLTYEAGKFVVRFGTVARDFRTLGAARLCFDATASGTPVHISEGLRVLRGGLA